MPIKRILFATDLKDPDLAVLPTAASLAERMKADLHLYHAIGFSFLARSGAPEAFPARDDLAAHALAVAGEQLEQIRQSPVLEGLEVTTGAAVGPEVSRAVINEADERGADLIVVGSELRSAFKRILLGSVAEQVMRGAHVPVLLCPRQPVERRSLNERPAFKKVLFPTDLSAQAGAVLEKAVAVARAYDASLDVVHVVEDVMPAAYRLAGVRSILDLQPDIVEKAKVFLTHEILEHTGTVRCTEHVSSGRPAAEIIKVARECKTDLIVMATHGHDSVGDTFLGSTTDRVVRTANLPVLVFHGPNEDAE